ncbi:MAG: CapA family protein [Cyclobacteriaceae bacterium]
MRCTVLFLLFSILTSECLLAQDDGASDTLKLVFAGDIMGHDSQIAASKDLRTGAYDYYGVFEKVSPILKKADFAIANLEVTLAGPPFKGYPQFSSPDELAVACQENGIDVLVTANNHSCDRRTSGILRTIDVLDSLSIPHTGTFKDSADWKARNLLILEKKGMKIGLLNYTYGTNGIPVRQPTMVNLINWSQMALDIEASKKENLDKLIVFVHWGKEYQSQPSDGQVKLAEYLFTKGADVVIGSHPHVLQKMEYFPKTENRKERFVAYSLGNFVSNQRTRKRDGGAIVELSLVKNDETVQIAKNGYHLVWVNKPIKQGRSTFQIIPGGEAEQNYFTDLDKGSVEKLKVFLDDSRSLLMEENVGVDEIIAVTPQ